MDDQADISRETLQELRRDCIAAMKDYLDISYKYMNFYIGLNSAILTATLAGLLHVEKGDERARLLAAGPVVVIVVSVIAFLTVRVFYRRHIEAWVTLLNVNHMLKLDTDEFVLEPSLPREQRFESESPGFMAQYERPRIAKFFRDPETITTVLRSSLSK
jgi:hypothetical protein